MVAWFDISIATGRVHCKFSVSFECSFFAFSQSTYIFKKIISMIKKGISQQSGHSRISAFLIKLLICLHVLCVWKKLIRHIPKTGINLLWKIRQNSDIIRMPRIDINPFLTNSLVIVFSSNKGPGVTLQRERLQFVNRVECL